MKISSSPNTNTQTHTHIHTHTHTNTRTHTHTHMHTHSHTHMHTHIHTKYAEPAGPAVTDTFRSKRWEQDCPIAGCKGQKGARGDVGPIGPRVSYSQPGDIAAAWRFSILIIAASDLSFKSCNWFQYQWWRFSTAVLQLEIFY